MTFRFKTKFAEDIFRSKYSQGPDDSWPNLCRRLVNDVCGDRSLTAKPTTYSLMSKADQDQLVQYMIEMKFIPGGRYLYYAGRPASFFNNCFSGDTSVLTDKGYKKLRKIAGTTVNVFSPIEGTFLPATIYNHGKQQLQKITFKQYLGSGNRYEIYATRQHHWPLQDGTDTYDLRVGDVVNSIKRRPVENSLGYIHGILFGDGCEEYVTKQGVICYKVRLCGDKNTLLSHIIACCQVEELNYSLHYPPSAKGDVIVRIKTERGGLKELPNTEDTQYLAGFIRGWVDTDGHSNKMRLIASVNEEAIDFFIKHAVCAGLVITGRARQQTRDTQYNKNSTLYLVNYQEGYQFRGFRVESIEPYGEEDVYCPYEPKHQRIIIDNGIDTFNCFVFIAEEDTREEWASIAERTTSALMSGGGIGVDYSILRPSGRTLSRTGGISSGPIPLMHIVNEIGRNVMQGGSRRSAMFASLNWQHEDIQDFIVAKNWSEDMKRIKAEQFDFPLPLDMTNISVNWDTHFINHDPANYPKNCPDVWYQVVKQMCQTGEPGMCFNFYENEKDTGRNACTEFTSEDDSDVCNLGSANLGNISSITELQDVVNLASKFLVCGTIRGELPFEKVRKVREENRKIGLGLMGVHEWLLQRGYSYEVNDELKSWLEVYRSESKRAAREHCDRFYLSHPKKYRAVAPAGYPNVA